MLNHPDCQKPDECRIAHLGTSTRAGVHCRFDGHGQRIGFEPSVITANFDCSTCGRLWASEQRHACNPVIVNHRGPNP